jgi:hypothetical protein
VDSFGIHACFLLLYVRENPLKDKKAEEPTEMSMRAPLKDKKIEDPEKNVHESPSQGQKGRGPGGKCP